MTAIDTFADLIRTLDENPQLREELRVRILPREILELPQQLAALAAVTEEHKQANARQFAALNKQVSALDQKVEEYQQANARHFAALDQKVEANTRQISALDQKVEEYQQTNTQRFDDQDRRAEEYKQASEQRFRRIENDLAYLKGSHARYAALEYAEVIAEEMGLEYVRSLTRPDLYRMVRNADTAGISANALSSFRQADLIMESVNAAGETCYIAVEISFTADGRDTGRAIRNAALLTRFTGKAAHAAVAGIYRDNRILSQLESGEVVWHQLRQDDLEVD